MMAQSSQARRNSRAVSHCVRNVSIETVFLRFWRQQMGLLDCRDLGPTHSKPPPRVGSQRPGRIYPLTRQRNRDLDPLGLRSRQ